MHGCEICELSNMNMTKATLDFLFSPGAVNSGPF